MASTPGAAVFNIGIPCTGFFAGGNAQELDFIVHRIAVTDLRDHALVNQADMRTGRADGIAQRITQRCAQKFDAGRDFFGLVCGQCRAIRKAHVGDAVHSCQFGAQALVVFTLRQLQLFGGDRVDMLAVSDDRGHG